MPSILPHLIAKRELSFVRALKRLGRLDALITDDIGYVQQCREEMEVLFTFRAERVPDTLTSTGPGPVSIPGARHKKTLRAYRRNRSTGDQ